MYKPYFSLFESNFFLFIKANASQYKNKQKTIYNGIIICNGKVLLSYQNGSISGRMIMEKKVKKDRNYLIFNPDFNEDARLIHWSQ